MEPQLDTQYKKAIIKMAEQLEEISKNLAKLITTLEK